MIDPNKRITTIDEAKRCARRLDLLDHNIANWSETLRLIGMAELDFPRRIQLTEWAETEMAYVEDDRRDEKALLDDWEQETLGSGAGEKVADLAAYRRKLL